MNTCHDYHLKTLTVMLWVRSKPLFSQKLCFARERNRPFMEVMFLQVTESVIFTDVTFSVDRSPHFGRCYDRNIV